MSSNLELQDQIRYDQYLRSVWDHLNSIKMNLVFFENIKLHRIDSKKMSSDKEYQDDFNLIFLKIGLKSF